MRRESLLLKKICASKTKRNSLLVHNVILWRNYLKMILIPQNIKRNTSLPIINYSSRMTVMESQGRLRFGVKSRKKTTKQVQQNGTLYYYSFSLYLSPPPPKSEAGESDLARLGESQWITMFLEKIKYTHISLFVSSSFINEAGHIS